MEESGVLQLALKILTNATSHGIFVELNVDQADPEQKFECFGGGEDGFSIGSATGGKSGKVEKPGKYFHQLLATLITGAARLMLMIAERRALDAGLDWAFCDTDSMAIAKPDGTEHEAFVAKYRELIAWFDPLNPYETKEPLFKIEEANYRTGSKEFAPLHCYAVSSKRYALFNIGPDGAPILRKASAHGLGDKRAPYGNDDPARSFPNPAIELSEIGVERWQYDLWYRIVTAALIGRFDAVSNDFHSALELPAMGRYAATTPEILNWFKVYNAGRPYPLQVNPFNFLSAFHAFRSFGISASGDITPAASRRKRKAAPRPLRPIAPFNPDPREAAKHCFDRETGQPTSPGQLKTYAQALADYHLRPESKFENGDYYDRGPTRRRHIRAIRVDYIGKEANRCPWACAMAVACELPHSHGRGRRNGEYHRGSADRRARVIGAVAGGSREGRPCPRRDDREVRGRREINISPNFGQTARGA